MRHAVTTKTFLLVVITYKGSGEHEQPIAVATNMASKVIVTTLKLTRYFFIHLIRVPIVDCDVS